MFQLQNLSSEVTAVVLRLRPPFAKPSAIAYGYAAGGTMPNSGYTLTVPSGEPLVAPGDGIIEQAVPAAQNWRFTSPSYYDTTASYAIVINHGQGVRTVVHGLQSVLVTGSQAVQRGQLLGYAADVEVFIGVNVNGSYVDPSCVNRHFVAQDGNVAPGYGGFLRQAPDILIRSAGTVVSYLLSGLRFFSSVPPPPVLFNIAFNGNGLKTGLAATGVAPTDFWNAYAPVNFAASYSYACFSGGAQSFSSAPTLPLLDYSGTAGPVWLERLNPMLAISGSTASWDEMLASWLGGYAGSTPYTNTFNIRGLPPGGYSVYLYANQAMGLAASTFMVSVNGGTPTSLSNSPTTTPVFLNGENYVVFSVVLPYAGKITVSSIGYLSGLQVIRV